MRSNGLVPVDDAYHMVLAAKGSLVEYQKSQAYLRRLPKLENEVRQLQNVTSRLASHLMNKKKEDDDEVERLVRLRDQIQKTIAATDGARPAAGGSIDVATILKSLREDSTVVDYVEYVKPSLLASLGGREEKRLCAFVYSKNSPIRFVQLGPSGVIGRKLNAWLEAIRQEGTTGKPDGVGTTHEDVDRLGDEVRRLMWDPVFLDGDYSSHVVISPDGPLNACPFSALPSSRTDGLLVESCAISYTIAPRLIADQTSIGDSPGRSDPALLLVGDIDYGDIDYGDLTMATLTMAT